MFRQGCNHAASSTTTKPGSNWSGYSCSSTHQLKSTVKAASKKGFAVDDPSLANCSDELVAHWPHSPEVQRVNSLRLFSAWKKLWNQDDVAAAWANIKLFLDNNDAKVLLGLDMVCDKEADAWEWKQAFSLMKSLGQERVMGVAFGNEMDNKKDCRMRFKDGDFFQQMKSWVKSMDDAGFSKVPVTVVWAMGVLGNNYPVHLFDPELEGFLHAAHEEWGQRFVWTFNPYPLWDPSLLPKSAKDCQASIQTAVGDYTRTIMGTCRNRTIEFTKTEDTIIWAGESGWSSPFVVAQRRIKNFCPEWASEETLFKFYESMMEWDLSVPADPATGKHIRGVDHLFLFAMRDFNGESFGLVKKCGASQCKIQASPVSEGRLHVLV